jgi:hypothetical protein
MVYCQTKNPNLGKFLRALDLKMVIYFMAFWNICQTFWTFYDHLVHFVLIWNISFRFWCPVPRKIWQPWTHVACPTPITPFSVYSSFFHSKALVSGHRAEVILNGR